jgi:hypothetical protein
VVNHSKQVKVVPSKLLENGLPSYNELGVVDYPKKSWREGVVGRRDPFKFFSVKIDDMA